MILRIFFEKALFKPPRIQYNDKREAKTVTFKKLSGDRIKIVVSDEDLSLWGLTASSIVHNSPEAQDIFWYMIRKAEAETGFFAGEARLMVEALPQKNDGIILFMTKLSDESEYAPFPDFGEDARRLYKYPKEPFSLYAFSSFDALEKVLPLLPALKDSRLYYDKGTYFLGLLSGTKQAEHLLSEYGTHIKENTDTFLYLEEHAHPILKENALPTLKKYLA